MSGLRRLPRRVVGLCVSAVLLVAGLAACSSSSGSAPPVPAASSAQSGTGASSSDAVPLKPELAAMVSCMQDKGWNATARQYPDGATDFGLDYQTVQEKQVEAAQRACEKATGWKSTPPKATEEQAGKSFDDLSRVAACLESHGYPVPEAPSRQSFVDALVGGSAIWSPYQLVIAAADGAATKKALDACPQKYAGS